LEVGRLVSHVYEILTREGGVAEIDHTVGMDHADFVEEVQQVFGSLVDCDLDWAEM